MPKKIPDGVIKSKDWLIKKKKKGEQRGIEEDVGKRVFIPHCDKTTCKVRHQ